MHVQLKISWLFIKSCNLADEQGQGGERLTWSYHWTNEAGWPDWGVPSSRIQKVAWSGPGGALARFPPPPKLSLYPSLQGHKPAEVLRMEKNHPQASFLTTFVPRQPHYVCHRGIRV